LVDAEVPEPDAPEPEAPEPDAPELDVPEPDPPEPDVLEMLRSRGYGGGGLNDLVMKSDEVDDDE
jgi:hypothetical protein